MKVGAPYGNNNAEKWTIKMATDFLNEAIKLANKKEINVLKSGNTGIEFESYTFDFIGEVARELGSYKSIFTELINKFPELKGHKKCLIETLEANCFCNSKKGAIKEASAIMNLKSNHKWTDRSSVESEIRVNTIELEAHQLNKIIDGL